MKNLSRFLLLSVIILSSLSIARAEINGAIAGFSYHPGNVAVLDNVTFIIQTKNTGTEATEYNLQLTISNEGQILDKENFSFSLKAGQAITFSPTFSPDTIGQYQVLVELFDKYGTKKFDSRIENINVVSTIGPFDLSIDIPSNVMRPGERIPALLSISNMGEKGTDVDVELAIPCLNQSTITKEFFVFIGSHSTYGANVPMDSCNEYGTHEIEASIILFNKTWITASSRFYESNSIIDIAFDVPDAITLSPGAQNHYGIYVKNNGQIPIHNLKLIISKIPVQWASIRPEIITEVNPSETVIFIANITAPSDAAPQNFTFGFYAASDEVLKRIQSNFILLPLKNSTSPNTQIIVTVPEIKFSYYLVVFVILLIVLTVLGIRTFATRRRNASGLGKIKSTIK